MNDSLYNDIQFNNLSNEDTAVKVGARHGEVVLLLIDAVQMYNDGIKFYKSANGVILVDYVAPEYIGIW